MPSTSVELANLIGEIVSGEAQGAAYAHRIMRPIVKSRELPVGFGSIVIPRFQKIAVAALSEGVAPALETLGVDGVTLTPVERGALVRISKTALRADPFSDLEPYGKEMGRALAADEDLLILTAFASLATSVVNPQVSSGGASNDLTLQHFLEAIGDLEALDAPMPYFAVFHPNSWSKLRAELDDAAAYSAVGKTVVEGFLPGYPSLNGYVGSPFGVPCFISTQVIGTRDTNATWDNHMFSPEAMGYAYGQDIGVDVDDNVPARAFDNMGWYTGHADDLVPNYMVRIEDKK